MWEIIPSGKKPANYHAVKNQKPDKFFIGKLSQNYGVSLSHSSTAL